MDSDIIKKLEENSAKLDAIYRSAEKTRKYILWTAIVSLALFILPMIGLLFAIPSYLKTISAVSGF